VIAGAAGVVRRKKSALEVEELEAAPPPVVVPVRSAPPPGIGSIGWAWGLALLGSISEDTAELSHSERRKERSRSEAASGAEPCWAMTMR